MLNKIRMLYQDKRPWFYLAGTASWGLILAMAVLLINTRLFPVMDRIPDVFLTSLSLAQTILSTLAGALLTITTFTFSTTMVVLTTYSSNYSPRVVENFLREKTTMKVLGTFVGGFVYSITALFFLGEVFTGQRVLSASVAIVYAIWCVIQFVIFIFSVGNSVQAQNLISKLYEEAKDIIDEFIRTNQDRRQDSYATDYFDEPHRVIAPGSGYLVAVDAQKIHQALAETEYRLVVQKQIGDFISKGEELGLLFSHAKGESIDGRIEKITRHFSFSSKRFTILDYRYAIQKIVDIALRSISPGINDPNTAISCIHSLQLLTGRLGSIEGDYQILAAEEDARPGEIILKNYNFKNDLYTTYSQLVYYGQADISVVTALLDAMAGALVPSTEGNRVHLREMAQYIYERSIANFSHPIDIARIEGRIQRIFRATL